MSRGELTVAVVFNQHARDCHGTVHLAAMYHRSQEERDAPTFVYQARCDASLLLYYRVERAVPVGCLFCLVEDPK